MSEPTSVFILRILAVALVLASAAPLSPPQPRPPGMPPALDLRPSVFPLGIAVWMIATIVRTG